jgi:hypothetical protein
MAFEKLSAKDQEIVLRCMRATVAHVEDWEKHSRLGLGSGELKVIIDQWPAIDDADENGNGFLAINNCLNEVCHGFRIEPNEWSNWFDTSEVEIKSTYGRWLSLRGLSSRWDLVAGLTVRHGKALDFSESKFSREA